MHKHTFCSDATSCVTAKQLPVVKYYTGIAGTEVSDLTSNAKYPGTPDEVRTLTTGSFETESDYGDNYGAVLEGFVKAPVSGKYRFVASAKSNDTLQVWVQKNAGLDERHAGLTKVLQYNANQTGEEEDSEDFIWVTWTADKAYMIRALMKAEIGPDSFKIGMYPQNGLKYLPLSLAMFADAPGIDCGAHGL